MTNKNYISGRTLALDYLFLFKTTLNTKTVQRRQRDENNNFKNLTCIFFNNSILLNLASLHRGLPVSKFAPFFFQKYDRNVTEGNQCQTANTNMKNYYFIIITSALQRL